MRAVLTLLLLTVATACQAQVSTTTGLTASTTTPSYGASVTFTATVTGSRPTGTVTFVGNNNPANVLGTCTLSNGSCTFALNTLLPGAQSVVAKYGRDSGKMASNSSAVNLTVSGSIPLASTTTTLSASPTSGPYGTTVTFIAGLTPTPNWGPPPASTVTAVGSMTFYNGATAIGTAPFLPAVGSGISTSLFGLTTGAYNPTPSVNYRTGRSWNYQRNISWKDINTSNGVYDWTNLDAWVAKYAGEDLIYTIGKTPQWASLYSSSPSGCSPPSSLTYWDKYLTAIATRYPQIKYWEIWNEPNDYHGWCGATTGSNGPIPTLATMSQHANSIIKAINPSAVILSPPCDSWYPGGAENGATWMTTFLAEGGVFDIFAFHGYTRSSGMAEDEVPIVASIRSVMAAASISRPIWDTEAGWYTGAQPVLPTARQPGFLAKMYIIQQSLGVARFLWYQYSDAPQWGQMWNSSTGENANVTAYNAVYNWLTGATLSGLCTLNIDSVETCNYTRPRGYSAQAVWETNSTRSTYTYSYPPGMTQYIDVTGAVHSLSGGTVTIGDAPILLENGNIPAYSATLSTTALPVGTHSVTATYGGDTYDAPSTSSPAMVTMTRPRTRTQ